MRYPVAAASVGADLTLLSWFAIAGGAEVAVVLFRRRLTMQ